MSIRVNHFGDDFNTGISIEKMIIKDFPGLHEKVQSERHDRHAFFLIEGGTLSMEIDFQLYEIKAPTIVYMHPNQVHRNIAFKDISLSALAINDENLHPEYLKLLEELTPTKPLLLKKPSFAIISETVSLAIKFSKAKQGPLYHSILKNSCNTLVALIITQFLEQTKPISKASRFEIVTKTFNELLEKFYTTVKSPKDYAKKLSISSHYLNECVKNATGHSVSYHIQKRIILEAKRLLYHSNKSVKEIAAELGFDDYPYFSRVFMKITGMTALTFRNKNHE